MSILDDLKFFGRCIGVVYFPSGVYNTDEWTLDSIIKTVQASYRPQFGAFYSSSDWTGYGLGGYYGQPRPIHGNKYGSYWPAIYSDLPIHCVCTSSKTEITWNNMTSSASSSVGLNGEQIYLLGDGHRSSYQGSGMGETVITRGGVELAHFYPCMRIADNVPVFWDSVSRTDVENVGSGVAGVVELPAA